MKKQLKSSLSNLEVGIIGLGKFGLKFGKTMMSLGQKVIGVDNDVENVKIAKGVLTQVYQADAMNKNVLKQIGFGDLNHVLVSVGDSIAASTMITMYLKELKIPSVWVKAVSQDHAKLLRTVGADEAIIPEDLAANQLAMKLSIPGFIEFMPFDDQIILQELQVNKWAGKTLRELNLTNQFSAQVIALKRAGDNQYRYIPKADQPLEKDDKLVVLVHTAKLVELNP